MPPGQACLGSCGDFLAITTYCEGGSLTSHGHAEVAWALVCYRTLARSFWALAAKSGAALFSAAATPLTVPPERSGNERCTRGERAAQIHCRALPPKKQPARHQKKGTMPRVARIRVPIYQETGKHTLYRIEVTTDDGRTRKVERRYRDVLRFHGTLCRAAPHPKLEQFDFPHKSILNTNAELTKERRRGSSRGSGWSLCRLLRFYLWARTTRPSSRPSSKPTSGL